MEQQELFNQREGFQDQDDYQNMYVNAKGVRKYLFFWIFPLIKSGNKQALSQEDVPNIREEDSSKWNFQEFKKHLQMDDTTSMKPFYLMIWKNFKWQLAILLLIQIVLSAMSALNPIIINKIILLFETDRPNYSLFWRTYIYFLIYLIIIMVGSPAYTFLKTILRIKVNGALKGLIIDKTIRASYPLPAQGDMLNLLMVDVQQIAVLVNSIVDVIMLPFQILMSVYVYFSMMGMPACVGVIGLSFQFLCNIIYAFYYAKMQVEIMECKDARMRSVNEMIFGINTIKQNGYFQFFNKRIGQKRSQEMQNIKYQQMLSLLISLISGYGFPIAVIFLTFYLFHIFSLANIIAVQQNYFTLVGTVNSIPGLISTFLVGGISIGRVMNFLNLKECEEIVFHDAINDDVAISIKDGSFTWNESILNQSNQSKELTEKQFVLDDVNFQIKKGEQVLFVGNTGSGKTSLMLAILGELQTTNQSQVQLNGSISIAQQEAWIQQDTILQNILHQDPLDKVRLMEILSITQLDEDLQQMLSGINSDIGENGATLSGGQRKRVHLSRALYQNKDIYLLDSPLSALDSKVGHQLAQRLMRFMKGKTLVIFSNSTQHWDGVDRIFSIDSGRVQEIQNKQPAFQDKKDNNDMNNYFSKLDDREARRPHNFEDIDKKKVSMVQDEDRQRGAIPKSVFKILFTFFGRWPVFLICGILCFLSMCLNLYYQQFLSQLTGIASEESTTQEQKSVAANKYLAIFPLLYGGQAIFSMSKNLIFMLKGISSSLVLHAKIVDNLLRASVQKFYNVILASRIKNRLSNDIYQFDMNISSNISSCFDQVFQLLAMFICTIAFSTIYTYPAQVVFIILIYVISSYYLKTTIELYRLDALSQSPMLNQFSEIVQGVIFLRHCSDVDAIKNKFFDSVDVSLRNRLSFSAVSQWFNQTTNILFIIIVYTAVLVANYLDLSLNEQQATIALYMSIGLSETIFGFVILLQDFYSNMIYFERCSYLMNSIPREDEYDEERNNEEQYSGDFLNAGSDVELRTIQTLNIDQQPSNAFSLQVTNLSAKYRPDFNLVLKNVSFTISPNEKIAIIGRTGSGKTSLIQCITRLINFESGSIACYGFDYNESTVDKMRQNFSVISQDPFTFEGSILQNIDPMEVYKDEDEIKRIIGEFTNTKINILDQMNKQVGELGKNLSLGERQLVVLIRIMLQKRRIVILDECTGSLDQLYSDLIGNMLKHYLKDKTVINVTHKLDTIVDSDRVILIASGEIQIIGSVKDVLGQYKNQE